MKSEIIQTVDVALLTIKDNKMHVTLIERKNNPYQGHLALPGGYIHDQEDGNCFDAALRVLKTKTGIRPPYLEQLKTFSGRYRDPRGWSISVAYFALVPMEVITEVRDQCITLIDVDSIPSLPFDHELIIKTAIERVRNKAQYSSLPCYLAGDTFTLPWLQKIYEICRNEVLNKSFFRKKIAEMDVLEKVVGEQVRTGAHRPSDLYRLKDSFVDKLKTLDRGL